MWCDFQCETCSARDMNCMPPSKDNDLEEINSKNISTSAEFNAMCATLWEEEWEK